MRRLRILKRNTSGADRLKLGLLLLVVLVLAVMSVFHEMPRLLLAIMSVAFLLPYLIRNWLVDHCETVLPAMNMAAWGFVALSLAGDLIKPLVKSHEDVFACVLFGALSLYIGLYFWLLSDERIVRRA